VDRPDSGRGARGGGSSSSGGGAPRRDGGARDGGPRRDSGARDGAPRDGAPKRDSGQGRATRWWGLDGTTRLSGAALTVVRDEMAKGPRAPVVMLLVPALVARTGRLLGVGLG
jgi:hypothetical protein